MLRCHCVVPPNIAPRIVKGVREACPAEYEDHERINYYDESDEDR